MLRVADEVVVVVSDATEARALVEPVPPDLPGKANSRATVVATAITMIITTIAATVLPAAKEIIDLYLGGKGGGFVLCEKKGTPVREFYWPRG